MQFERWPGLKEIKTRYRSRQYHSWVLPRPGSGLVGSLVAAAEYSNQNCRRHSISCRDVRGGGSTPVARGKQMEIKNQQLLKGWRHIRQEINKLQQDSWWTIPIRFPPFFQANKALRFSQFWLGLHMIYDYDFHFNSILILFRWRTLP